MSNESRLARFVPIKAVLQRFVPVDGKILSIFQTTLIKPWREWDNKNLDRGMDVYLQLIEQVTPRGRTARFAKSRQEAGDPKKALVQNAGGTLSPDPSPCLNWKSLIVMRVCEN